MLEYLSFFGDIVTGIDDNKELNTASMLNAYPNPFNEQTNISVKLEQSFDASLMIYDINGKKVATLHEGHLDAGEHVFSWDGTDSRGHKLNSGIYVYQLISNSVNATKKLILN
jgi:flagellar hook assembly protein FlgD